MKNLISIFALIASLTLTFSACKKEEYSSPIVETNREAQGQKQEYGEVVESKPKELIRSGDFVFEYPENCEKNEDASRQAYYEYSCNDNGIKFNVIISIYNNGMAQCQSQYCINEILSSSIKGDSYHDSTETNKDFIVNKNYLGIKDETFVEINKIGKQEIEISGLEGSFIYEKRLDQDKKSFYERAFILKLTALILVLLRFWL